MTSGSMTPRRSDRRPIRMPPTPKPIIVIVYGSEASERATPNSACTAGSTTTTAYMPTPEIVISARLIIRRSHAYVESI